MFLKKIKSNGKLDLLLKDRFFKNLTAFLFATMTIVGGFYNAAIDKENNKKILIESIDESMLLLVENYNFAINPSFHENAIKKYNQKPNSKQKEIVSEDEDYVNIINLNKYIKNSRAEYIYTLIKTPDGKIRFTTSSATDNEMRAKQYTRFYDTYDEASTGLKKYFEDPMKIGTYIEETKDRWGSFRTVAMKFATPEGTPYIVAVDVRLEYINEILEKNQSYIYAVNSSAIVVLVLLGGLFFYASRRELNDIKLINDTLNKEMLKKVNRNLELIELSSKDPLSGLNNRFYFNQVADDIVRKIKRDSDCLSALVIDIDHFKKINDTYGHLVGDIAIKEMGRLLSSNVRDSDIAIRFGGEEFIVLLPQTKIEDAKKVAIKILKAIRENEFLIKEDEAISYTASIGIARFEKEKMTSIDQLIHNADIALYKAKETGRNKVVIYSEKLDKKQEEEQKKDV